MTTRCESQDLLNQVESGPRDPSSPDDTLTLRETRLGHQPCACRVQRGRIVEEKEPLCSAAPLCRSLADATAGAQKTRTQKAQIVAGAPPAALYGVQIAGKWGSFPRVWHDWRKKKK